MADMFWINFFNLMLGLQNLWISARFLLFEVDTNPVCDPISNGVTEGLKDFMSVRKCWYFSVFNL